MNFEENGNFLNLYDLCKTPLNYKGFEKYRIKNRGGWNEKQQWIFKFSNGYGASVVKHFGSYGFEDDLFELAVIYFDGNNWHLTYNTPITNDVIGYLTNDEVLELLKEIEDLRCNYEG